MTESNSISEQEIRERVQRARERNVEFTVANNMPLVVEADSENSGRIHTLVPNAMHCSCEDSTYRSPICYHMLALAMTDSLPGEVMLEELESNRDEFESREAELREQADQYGASARVLRVALEEIEDVQIEEELEELEEDVSEEIESDDTREEVLQDLTEDVEDDVDELDEDSDFRQMIEQNLKEP